MMYVALMDVISELRNPPPLCTWCLAKLLRDDVITFIKIEPTGEVGPLLQMQLLYSLQLEMQEVRVPTNFKVITHTPWFSLIFFNILIYPFNLL